MEGLGRGPIGGDEVVDLDEGSPGSKGERGEGGLQDRLSAIAHELGEVSKLQEQLRLRQQSLEAERERLSKIADEEAWQASRKDWGGAFAWDAGTHRALQALGHQEFRPLQREAVNAVMGGRDVLCIMPAGGGKSLCYQLPVLAAEGGQGGFAVVISPLLSLIGDQLSHLRKIGVHCAALTSASKGSESSVYAGMLDPSCSLKLLYVTPERVAKSKRFMSKLEKAHDMGLVRLFAVDEAHCCSAWGHDFRTDYQALVILKRRFESVPLLALTATATRQVQRDIKEMLGLRLCETFQGKVDRKNLFYEVLQKTSTLPEACQQVHRWINDTFRTGGVTGGVTAPGSSDSRGTTPCGLVYCFSKKETEQVCGELRGLGIPAMYYHADLEHDDRSRVYDLWCSGEIRVIVCTVAFGMGIDKANVRFVVHFTMAKSIENYYQESGRAGRDGKYSRCMILWRPQDLFRQSTMACTEKSWPGNTYKMARFCQSASCRHAEIARHFREEAGCSAMCDVCARGSIEVREQVDISASYRDIMGILRDAEAEGERLTLRKLVDRWKRSKGAGSRGTLQGMRLPERTSYCESVVVELLLEGYLSEDIGWNAYSTTSYLKPGARAALGAILMRPQPSRVPAAQAGGVKRGRPIDLG